MLRTAVEPEALNDPESPLRRYIPEEGCYSLGFVICRLDNIAAISRMMLVGAPQFTTRYALRLARRYIPVSERLVLVSDRANRYPTAFSTVRPVTLKGKEEGTETCEVALFDRDFTILLRPRVVRHPPYRSHQDAAKFGVAQAPGN